MLLEHLWRMHLFVSQLGFPENFRLQLELHELLHPPALHQHFGSLLVNRHAQFVFLREENCPLLRRKFEPEFFEQRTKFCRLLFRKGVSVRVHLWKTSNAQRSTPNAQL